MQRYIIAFLFLCLHTMARGQTDDAPLYYWFDSEHETLYSDSTGSGQWKQMVDASQLKVGLHTFYVITTDSKGRVSTPEMRQFYKIDQSADGEQYRCLCYVDGEMFCQKEVSANGGLIDMELDATGLSEGMHRIQLQVLTASGVVSGIHNGFFLRTATTQELGRLRCMCYVDGMLFSEESMSAKGGVLNMNLDASGLAEGLHSIQMQVITETGVVSGVYNGFFIRKSMEQEIGQFHCLCYVDGELFSQEKMSAEGGLLALDLDTNSLTEGLHRIQLQVMTKSGIISGAYNGFFLRTATAKELGQFLCLCYVDGEMYSQKKLSAEGGLLHLDLNASSLSEGMHRIQLQVMTENGTISGTYNGFFLRIPTQEEQSNYSCIYAVDDETESHKFDLTGNDGVYHFDLDMSGLSDGLHHISYFLSSDKGVSSSPQTRFFIKSPTGGNAIARYQYWLNDDFEGRKDITLPKPQNPFKLISLLPVEKVPVRSNQFHFEIKDGEPMMYAKNDFHVRFYDAGSRFTDETKQYVDYNVSREVENMEEIQESQIVPSFENNEVKWYWFDVGRGDSIAFKSSVACSMTLFDSEGKISYSVSGYESTKFGGCHIKNKGTYYLAVHDIAGTNTQSVRLSYYHLSRYAVLEHTPDVAGLSPYSSFTIHLSGNGFDKLKDATLIHGNQIIKMDGILSATSSKADVRFVIDTGYYEFGDYNLQLVFVDEEGLKDMLLVNKAIHLEQPVFAEVTVEMRNKSNVRPYPLSVVLKNEGNMTYSYIPLNIAWDNPLDISDVKFKNFYATMTAENDSAGYQPIVLTDNLLDKGIDGAVMFFYIPQLGPHETLELQLGFSAPARSHFNIYAWTGTPLERDTLTLAAMGKKYLRRANTSDRGQNILSFGDAVETATGLRGVPNVVQQAGRLSNSVIKTGATIGSMQNVMGRSIGNAYADAYGVDDATRELIKSSYEELYPEVLTPGQIIGGNVGAIVDCLMGFQRQCADQPDPDPGSSHHGHITAPVDPNDIIGYTAESGSLYMREGLEEISYTVEFENDPEQANASAHTIIVTDTIDSNYFDLASFAVTSLQIGNKHLDLAGDKNFVTTVDMRPEINAIAQVTGTYDEQKGIAQCKIESLDPMTMEPTDDPMEGVLPVNVNGSGIGEVSYNISLKPGLAHGSEVNNRAAIVFDNNEVIMTPTWTNIMDLVAPESRVTDVWQLNDSLAVVTVDAADGLSGVWRYDVYVQYGSGAWFKAAENVPADTTATVKIYDGIDHGFYVVLTDSAGNVERKQAMREQTLNLSSTVRGDVNGDGQVGIADIVAVTGYMAGTNSSVSLASADVNGDGQVGIADIVAITDIMAGTANMTSRQNARYKTYFVKRKE